MDWFDDEYIDHAGYCSSCLDTAMHWCDEPIWATDQCEVYEAVCPDCGHTETRSLVYLLGDQEWEMFAEYGLMFEQWRKDKGLESENDHA